MKPILSGNGIVSCKWNGWNHTHLHLVQDQVIFLKATNLGVLEGSNGEIHQKIAVFVFSYSKSVIILHPVLIVDLFLGN